MDALQPHDDRIPLTPAVVARLEQRMQDHRRAVRAGVFARNPEAHGLPACPECGAEPTELSWTTSLMDATLINFQPCGHRFRMVPTAADYLRVAPGRAVLPDGGEADVVDATPTLDELVAQGYFTVKD